MGVPNAIGDVWVTGVIDKVLFFFRTHPTIKVTSKYVKVNGVFFFFVGYIQKLFKTRKRFRPAAATKGEDNCICV